MPRLNPVEKLEAYPEKLKDAELRLLGLAPGPNRDSSDPAPNLVGVALSGGGIRSATFSLGVFQSLARLRLLEHVKFLSTVSGGGYFGGFFGRLLHRNHGDIPGFDGDAAGGRQRKTAERLSIEDVEAILENSGSSPLRFLRRNGRYLAPGGSGDLLSAFAVVLRNWVAAQVVVGFLVFLLLLVLAVLRYAAWDVLPGVFLPPMSRDEFFWLSPFAITAAAALVLAVLPFGWAYWFTPDLHAIGRGFGWIRSWVFPVAIAIAAAAFPCLRFDPLPTGVAFGIGAVGAAAIL
jgi:hypothetical protein